MSTVDLRCGTNGASMLRIVDQSTPAKKGWLLTSSAELRPTRVSAEQIILRTRSSDSRDRCTSSGMCSHCDVSTAE